jgi:hypothetical protein
MSIGDLFWLFIFSAIQPMLRQRMLEACEYARFRNLNAIENRG